MKSYCHNALEKSGVSEVGAKTILMSFFYYYLDAAMYSLDECLAYTKAWLKECCPEIATEYPRAEQELRMLFE